jgi:uncharacterized phiE125 gp8 family phage protein
MTEYTTVAAVKQALSFEPKSITDNGLLEECVASACDQLDTELMRNILSASYTETYNSPGGNVLMLRNFPVTAVAGVEVGPPSGRTAWDVDTDYVFDEYGITSMTGKFLAGIAGIVVSYTAGYAELPGDLKRGATKLAALRYKQLTKLGQNSKTLGGETVNFDTRAFPDDVQRLIDKYSARVPI